MKIPRPLAWVSAGVAVVVIAAGALVLVGGDDDPSTGADDAEPAGPPRPGGSITLALERPPTLDPADADRGIQAELILADIMFDGLTAFDGEKNMAVASIAERWASSDDLLLWSFQLRADARFHDGTPVTADDVKFTLERIARKGQDSAGSVQLELIDGYRQLAIDGSADQLTGVIVKDARTIEIALTEPSTNLPMLLSNPIYGVVPKAAVAAPDPPFGTRPVGSGPFRIERVNGTTIELVRAEGVDAYLEGVTLRFHDTAAEAYAAFADGEADFTRVPAERVSEAAGAFGADRFVPYGAELFYGINLRKEKFSDVRFREAIVRAIDRDAIVTDIYGDTVLPLDSILPQGVPGHRDDVCDCEHDPERAEALIAQVFPEGNVPEVRIDFDEGAPQDSIADHIRRDLEAVGIPAVLRARPFDDASDDDYQAFVASGEQELFRLGWIGAYPSPEVYLGPLFATGSPDNVVGFSDSEVDAALTEARRMTDLTARRARFAQVEEKILAKYPIVPLVQFQTHAVTSERVEGLAVTVAGTFDITQVWVTDGASTADPTAVTTPPE